MNFQKNKMAIAMISCLSLYSTPVFAWTTTQNYADNAKTLPTGQHIYTLVYNTALISGTGSNSSDYVCLSKADNNLTLTPSTNSLKIERKDMSSAANDSTLAAALCSYNQTEGKYTVGTSTTACTANLPYEVTINTSKNISCDALASSSSIATHQKNDIILVDSVSACKNGTASTNFTLDTATGKITYTGITIKTQKKLPLFLCGTDLNTNTLLTQDLTYSVSGEDNVGGSGTLIGGRYYKLDVNGNKLGGTEADVIARTDHACVQDTQKNVTWEVKQADMPFSINNLKSYHLASDRITWYNGTVGDLGGDSSQCKYLNYVSDRCNSQAFTALVNRKGWCGLKNWKMPTPDQLLDLKPDSLTGSAPYIIGKTLNLFPNTQNDVYYSGQLTGNKAKAAEFGYAGKYIGDYSLQSYRSVRLVSE